MGKKRWMTNGVEWSELKECGGRKLKTEVARGRWGGFKWGKGETGLKGANAVIGKGGEGGTK